MNNLKLLRNKKKMSVRNLSEKININSSTLNRLENNETSFNNEYIVILTSFFNVSSDYLLGLSNIPNPKPHEFKYYVDSSNFLTLEDLIKKYKHDKINVVFRDDFIKIRFDDDPTKQEITYQRVK